MSMNLHCTGVELRQTPTQVTYMCLVQPDGKIACELKGKKALHAMQIYKEWVKYCRNGVVFNDPQDLIELLVIDKEHLVAVEKAIKNKRLKVWMT